MRSRLIVKIGSSSLVDGKGRVRFARLVALARDVAAERAAGRGVAIVSSGAIALGACQLGLRGGGRASLEDAQAAAAVGQIALAKAWTDALGEAGLTAAQLLLTRDDLEDRRRYLNACATLDRLFALGVVPVVNENDSVATEEIRFGDNDRLAARLAVAVQAARLVLLSDVDGLHTADPTTDPGAQRIATVTAIDDAIERLANDGAAGGMGTGGMRAKLAAARIATRGGVELIVAAATDERPLARLAAGGGTRFLAQEGVDARAAWLQGRATAAGTLTIDDGAAAALADGASLLAAGITGVGGRFERGDVVDIAARDRPIARGLVEYAADEVRRIAGRRSDAIAAILGAPPRAAVVHRNHMVRL